MGGNDSENQVPMMRKHTLIDVVSNDAILGFGVGQMSRIGMTIKQDNFRKLSVN